MEFAHKPIISMLVLAVENSTDNGLLLTSNLLLASIIKHGLKIAVDI
jgi:hypothetical protein